MVRAVLDTNIFISGAIGSSYPAKIIDAWKTGKYVLVTSRPIIEEVSEVLRRPEIRKFTKLLEKDIKEIIDALKTKAFVASGEFKVNVIAEDPDDNKFLACALEGFADYIVTGDKKHLLPLENYQGVKIINPKEFLKSLDRG